MVGACSHELSLPLFRLILGITLWRCIFALRPQGEDAITLTSYSLGQAVRGPEDELEEQEQEPGTTDCHGRCEQFLPNAKCQCHQTCFDKNNCCSDYIFTCRLADETDKEHSKPGHQFDDLNFFQMLMPVMTVVLFITLVTGFALVRFITTWFDSQEFSDIRRQRHGFVDRILVYRFIHPMVEKNYKSWSEERELRSACGMFAFVLVIEGVLAYFGCSAAGWQARNWSRHYFTFAWIVFGTLYTSLLLLSFHGLMYPRRLSYYFTLTGCFALKVALQGPPLSPSCAYLIQSKERIPGKAFALDCSMLGKSTVHHMIVWVLMSSFMMAFHEDIYLVLVWLLGFAVVSHAWETVLDQDIFPPFTMSHQYALYIFAFLVAASARKRQEYSMRVRFYHEMESSATAKRMFGSLNDMIPGHLIVPMMTKLGETISEDLPCVSVLFILIADFDMVTKTLTPTMLLTFLNVTFSDIDDALQEHQVTKIETVGEEYVAAVGVSPSDQNQSETKGHAILLDRLFASAGKILMMNPVTSASVGKPGVKPRVKPGVNRHLSVRESELQHSKSMRHRRTEVLKIKFKMGVQTGPIVAGIVGKKLPRYRLFGDTMNSAARMMQKALPGTLQFGKSTFDALSPDLQLSVECRGKVEMKGKGAVDCWTFSGARFEEEDSEHVLDKWKNFAGVLQLVEDERESNRLSAKFEGVLFELSQKEHLSNEPFKMHPEMFEKWMLAHHEANFASVRIPRVGLTCMVVLLFTAYEYYLSTISMAVYKYPHQVWPVWNRVYVFLVFRACVLLLLMANWYLARITNKAADPADAMVWAIVYQNLFMFFDATCLIFVGVSYDALYFSNTGMYKELMKTLFDHEWYVPPGDQRFRIHSVIVLHLILYIHPYRHWHVMLWLPLILIWDFLHGIMGWFTDPSRRDSPPFTTDGYLLFISQALLRIASAIKDEHEDRKLFIQKQYVMNMQTHSTRILDTLLPVRVVEEMALNAQHVPCHQYRHAVIVQSDLCGFTKLMSTKTPHQVVSYMGSLFGIFDDITDVHQVYKIETVGDAYIAGMAEPPLSDLYSPINVIVLGLDMVRAVDDWSMNLKAGVTCRVGIHYGEVIGGIVGKTAKRYHLFGETMAILEVLESTSVEGRVQISSSCKSEVERQLKDQPFAGAEEVGFKMREDSELSTSKGEKHSYDEVGGPTYFVESMDKALRHIPMKKERVQPSEFFSQIQTSVFN